MHVLHAPFHSHSSPKRYLPGALFLIVTVAPWIVLFWLIWPRE
jgi:hypothetical protein